MSTLISLGGLKTSIYLDAVGWHTGMTAVAKHADATRQQIIAGNAAIQASNAATAASFNTAASAAAQAATKSVQQQNTATQATRQHAAAQTQLAALQQRVAAAETDAAGRVRLYTTAVNAATAGSKDYYQAQLKLISAQKELEREQSKTSRSGGAGLQQALTGAGGQLLGVLGIAGGFAAVGQKIAQFSAEGQQLIITNDGIRRGLGALVGDQQRANTVFEQATAFAEKYKLTVSDTGQAVQSAALLIKNSTQPVEKILEVMTRLSTLAPEQGISGAGFAIRELASGDIQSIADRFNVGRKAANQWKDEIAAGGDAIEVLDRGLQRLGVGQQSLTALTEGATGAQRDYNKALEDFKLALGQARQESGLQQAQTGVLKWMTDQLTFVGKSQQQNDALARSATSYEDYVKRVNAAWENLPPGFVDMGTTPTSPVTPAQYDAIKIQQQADAHRGNADAATANARALAALNNTEVDNAAEVARLTAQYDQWTKSLATATDRSLRPYKAAVDAATDALKVHQATTKAAKDTVDNIASALDKARQTYQSFASAQLVGTKAYADQQFALDQQSAKVQRDLLNFKAPGAGLDQLLAPIQQQIDATSESLKGYASDLDEINSFVDEQTRVVAEATAQQKAYDDAVGLARTNLDQQTDRLSALQDQYDSLSNAINEAKRAQDDLRRAPLVGEGALDDKLFAMDQAVKRQQLAIARAQDRGAGKDELKRMNEQLDRLRRAEDEARLAGELRYDAQHRALEKQGIDQAAQEKTYEEASHDISQYQAGIEQLTEAQSKAAQAVEDQKKVVSDAKWDLLDASAVQRDHTAAVEAEKATLERLKETQKTINDQYSEQKTKLADLHKQLDTTRTDALKPFQDQLDELGRRAEVLKLDEKLELDPLRKSIDDTVNHTKELTFQEIIDGLKNTNDLIAILEPRLASATNILEHEQAATKAAQTTVDVATAALDAEQKYFDALKVGLDDMKTKLTESKNIWGDLSTLISAINSANTSGGMPGMRAPFTPQGGTGSGAYSIDAINQILDKTGLSGMGAAIAKFAEEYRVPASLAIAMFRKESSLLTAGSSVSNNNPGNIVYTGGAYGEDRAGGRFGHYPTVEAGVEAYFKLLDREYRRYLDSGNIAGLINKYAPPFENNTTQYIEQINAWMTEYAKMIQAAATQAATGQGPLGTILAALGLEGSQVTTQYSAAHPALDLAGREAGTPIHALEGGRVKFSQWNDAWGNFVVIEDAITHKLHEYYGHLQQRMVKEGDIIKAGDVIGTLGGTGSESTGVHLHLQMYDENGNLTDPMTEIAKMFGTGQGPTTAQIAGLMAYLQALKDIGDVSYTTAAGMDAVDSGMSIAGPNLETLAGNIAGVGDAAATTADAIVTATDDILDHVKLIGDLSDKLGYKGGMPDMGYTGATDPFSFSGPDKQFNDPTWGDMIAAAATSTVDAVKQVQEVTPLWDVSWQTMGDSTVAALDLAERTAKGASDNIVQYVNGAILRIEELISAIGDIPGIHVDTGAPGPIHGGSPGPSPPGERRPATHHASEMIVPTSKTGGGDTHIWNIDARGSSMNEQQFKKVIEDAMAKRDREFGQRAKGR